MLLQRPQRLRGLHAQQQQHGSFSRGSQCACRPKQQQLRSSRCRASQPEAEPASAAGSMMPPLEIAGSAPAPAGWGPQQQQPPQQAAQPDRQGQLPDVDWSRYHLQVLFVDSTDQLRARLAAGLFDKVRRCSRVVARARPAALAQRLKRAHACLPLLSALTPQVAEWNGYGRALYSWTAGTRTAPAAESLSARAGLMAQVGHCASHSDARCLACPRSECSRRQLTLPRSSCRACRRCCRDRRLASAQRRSTALCSLLPC